MNKVIVFSRFKSLLLFLLLLFGICGVSFVDSFGMENEDEINETDLVQDGINDYRNIKKAYDNISTQYEKIEKNISDMNDTLNNKMNDIFNGQTYKSQKKINKNEVYELLGNINLNLQDKVQKDTIRFDLNYIVHNNAYDNKLKFTTVTNAKNNFVKSIKEQTKTAAAQQVNKHHKNKNKSNNYEKANKQKIIPILEKVSGKSTNDIKLKPFFSEPYQSLSNIQYMRNKVIYLEQYYNILKKTIDVLDHCNKTVASIENIYAVGKTEKSNSKKDIQNNPQKKEKEKEKENGKEDGKIIGESNDIINVGNDDNVKKYDNNTINLIKERILKGNKIIFDNNMIDFGNDNWDKDIKERINSIYQDIYTNPDSNQYTNLKELLNKFTKLLYIQASTISSIANNIIETNAFLNDNNMLNNEIVNNLYSLIKSMSRVDKSIEDYLESQVERFLLKRTLFFTLDSIISGIGGEVNNWKPLSIGNWFSWSVYRSRIFTSYGVNLQINNLPVINTLTVHVIGIHFIPLILGGITCLLMDDNVKKHDNKPQQVQNILVEIIKLIKNDNFKIWKNKIGYCINSYIREFDYHVMQYNIWYIITRRLLFDSMQICSISIPVHEYVSININLGSVLIQGIMYLIYRLTLQTPRYCKTVDEAFQSCIDTINNEINKKMIYDRDPELINPDK